jgi:ribosomal protein L20A (L18A)
MNDTELRTAQQRIQALEAVLREIASRDSISSPEIYIGFVKRLARRALEQRIPVRKPE